MSSAQELDSANTGLCLCYPALRLPYVEAEDGLPRQDRHSYPFWFFNAFRQLATHALLSPALSNERATWLALLLSPGWGGSREEHSRGMLGLGGAGVTIPASAIRGIGPELVTADMPAPTGEETRTS
jgi:hypothetical protein